ncbi:thioredoxin-like protein 4B isoform X1 [Odocoileus virginianus]|uniref:Thioredoxin-like protein 4B isoform X1 n=1 Tax=Odocoileus virginianus TaxID=9874 RepID=A0ABM4GV28_ODOVR
MSFLLPKLSSKKAVDQAIKSTAEKVLVLRFGRDNDPVCLQLDDILSKTSSDLSKMATIYLVDVDQTPVYTHYFDISYIPSTVFFFNGQHMKVDYGIDCFDLLAVQATLKSLLQHHNLKASILQHSAFMVQLTSIHDYWKKNNFDLCWESDVSAF